MKKIIYFTLLLVSLFTFGQVPQGISYQAIALNSSGNPVASSSVRIRLSVLDVSATGTSLYSETHLKTTNAQGLFNLTIGQGTVVSGVFNTINWGTNSKFLKVEMDATGGTTYVAVGTTQLLSVPYAMYAGSVTSIATSAVAGIGTDILKTSNFIVRDGQNVKGFYNGVWSTQAFAEYVDDSQVTSSNGVFVIRDGQTVKGFYNGVWSSQTFNEYVNSNAIIESGGVFIIRDGLTVKTFYKGTWSTQSFSEYVDESQIIGSNGIFIVRDGQNVKGFYNGVWSTQVFAEYVDQSYVVSSNGVFIIRDGLTVKGFYNGVWTTQAFAENVDPVQIIYSEKN